MVLWHKNHHIKTMAHRVIQKFMSDEELSQVAKFLADPEFTTSLYLDPDTGKRVINEKKRCSLTFEPKNPDLNKFLDPIFKRNGYIYVATKLQLNKYNSAGFYVTHSYSSRGKGDSRFEFCLSPCESGGKIRLVSSDGDEIYIPEQNKGDAVIFDKSLATSTQLVKGTKLVLSGNCIKMNLASSDPKDGFLVVNMKRYEKYFVFNALDLQKVDKQYYSVWESRPVVDDGDADGEGDKKAKKLPGHKYIEIHRTLAEVQEIKNKIAALPKTDSSDNSDDNQSPESPAPDVDDDDEADMGFSLFE